MPQHGGRAPGESLHPTTPGLSLTITPEKVTPNRSAQQPAPTHDNAEDGGEVAAVVESDEIDNDLADSLVKQLEARTDSEEESEEEGGGGVTKHKVVWSALQYAAHMAGMHHDVKEKLRVKSILSRELARTEKENTTTSNGRHVEPRKRPTLDGDLELYSVEKQRERRANKKSPGFLSAVRMIWNATKMEMAGGLLEQYSGGGASDAAAVAASGDVDGINKAAFVSLMIKVHFLIIHPPVDRAMAAKNACDDWAKDNALGSAVMTYDSFLESMFEMVDIWTRTSDAEEYDKLSLMIAKGVTNAVESTLAADNHEADSGKAKGSQSGGVPAEGGQAAAAQKDGAKGANEGANKSEDTKADGDKSEAAQAELNAKEGQAEMRLKADDEIVYNPDITTDPVYMEDLLADAGNQGGATTGDGGNQVGTGGKGEGGMADGKANDGYQAKGTGFIIGGRRLRWVRRKRRRSGDGKKPLAGLPDSVEGEEEDDSETGAAASSLSHAPRGAARAITLLSAERVNAIIAKVYLSKMQVDKILLRKDGTLSWVDKCRRKKAQRMDRFVFEYHIRQFGTKQLARRNLNQLCKSVTRLAPSNPRIEVFAALAGVPVMVQKKPYEERLGEFRPFTCSDFIIPMLAKLCPEDDKVDRWMGNAKVPVAVTISDFMQAIRDICPDVPVECPAFVTFTVKLGRLAGALDLRCRQEHLTKPSAGRPSIDLDEGLLLAMPVWLAEEEYLIMHVTLNAIGILRRWVQRAHRRMKAKASALDTNQTLHRSSCGDQQEDTRVNDTRERLKPATRSTRPKTSTRHTRKSRPPKKRVSSPAHDATSLPPSLLQSASSPAVSDVPVPTAGADGTLSIPAVTTATATDHRASVDMEGQGSPRARQRLEEAKALDREITISEGIDGGG